MPPHVAKAFNHLSHKLLTPKQMFQRLPMTLAQVKAGNTSEDVLNKIFQIIIYIFYLF